MINLSSLLGGGMLLKQQLITASGTWTRPAKMAGNTVWLTMIGGGSSGRRVSGSQVGWGGWGGQWLIQTPIDIGATTTVACTIGPGGAGTGAVDNVGNPGGPTSFGAFATVVGGTNSAAVQAGGAPGGVGGSSPIRPHGSDTPLGYGGIPITYFVSQAGAGGGLELDSSGMAGGAQTSVVTPATGYGAGGAAGNAPHYGFPGAPGAILVQWPEFV